MRGDKPPSPFVLLLLLCLPEFELYLRPLDLERDLPLDLDRDLLDCAVDLVLDRDLPLECDRPRELLLE